MINPGFCRDHNFDKNLVFLLYQGGKMSRIQIGFNHGKIQHFLIYFLCIPYAFASATYAFPVTSLQSNNNLNDVGKKQIFAYSKKTTTQLRNAQCKNTGCSSCHTGKHAYKRRSLLEKKDQLAEIIQDCNGPHKVYCHNGKSSLTKK